LYDDRRRRTSKRVSILSWIAAAMIAILPATGYTQPETDAGLSIKGVLAEYTVEPGQVLTHALDVHLGVDAHDPMDIQVDARGLGETPDGAVDALTADRDKNPLSAREFIRSIDPAHFRLQPGASQVVKATLDVPSDMQGTRYADVYVHSLPTGSGQVGTILAANVPVILSVDGAPQTATASIVTLSAARATSGQPIKIDATVTNTGNHHFKADAVVSLSDASGKQVAQQRVSNSGLSLLPGYPRKYSAVFTLLDKLAGLPAGTYTVQAQVVLPDGTVLDERRTSLQLTEAYQPFPGIDPASLVVTTFNDQEPGVIDARSKADVLLEFHDTGKVTGVVVIGRFNDEPTGRTPFAAAIDAGGTGKPGRKFVGVGVQGFSRGSADLSLFYRDNELNGISPNSLFLASLVPDGRWGKLDDQGVYPGANNTRGHLTVAAFNSNPIFGLGGEPESPPPAGSPLSNPLVVVVLALGVLILPSATLLLVMRRRRGEPGA
jgi:hypothetical protein